MREREPNKEIIEKEELFYLWHPETDQIFSGYGLTNESGRKDRLVGLLMVDRPQRADPEWLQMINNIFGDCRLVATDAACEGLNLQMLGTLINVDLPWNPSRLEQRLGRIKRFGQARHTVDMLNLVYSDTQDEKVYQVLSRRMKDRYDIFGGLPDTIDDEWIDNIELLEEMMDQYIHLREQARDVFEMRYQESIDPDKDRWELCSRVLSRRDVVDKLSTPW